MRKKEEAVQVLLEQKLLPLYYHESADISAGILKALYDAGIGILEYTNRGGNALDNFKLLRKTADKTMPGLLLGIGTIKTKKAAKKFIEAGADFIVCPAMNEEVAEVTHEEGLLWIPGCLSTTEIASAEEAGATIVKIFPGSLLGPSYISAIKEIFPSLKFMPTGGVEAEETNLAAWFGAGVVAVGMGSKLISSQIMEGQDYEGLRTAAAATLELIKKVTAGPVMD